MPLKDVMVVEFVGLAPGPLCGKILADFGASVLRIDKVIYNSVDYLDIKYKSTKVLFTFSPKGSKFHRYI